ncbi:phage tail tape measure protein [Pseudomonas protegens]|uniref:phage tail tape measure protein n=1 Tax=Pseudomonas protegens TaxID=380021 RepID=UPI001C8D8762|nr:phage tail tape measure protein [Pseudomonas protegens]QZI68667.1 phage tail tape measure protein [Pseudomonas protegens]
MAQESRLAIVIDSRNAQRQVDQLRNSLNGLQGAGGEATVSVRGLGTAARAAGGALAAIGVGAVTREVLRMTDAFKSMQGSLALVSTSTANANESFQKLLAMANNTGSSLESTVSLYTRLANATRGAGFSQDQLLNVTDALNKAFVISGATMQEASNAAIQLSQGLASGTLRGEELNSVMEQGPRITRAISEYLGVTNGQIRQMASEGKITSDVVTNALLQSLSSLNSELAKMPRRFEQASTSLKNNFLAAIGQINVDPVVSSVDALASSLAQPDVVMGIQQIATALGSVVAVGGDGLRAVAENTDVLMTITGAYAAKVGTGLVVSLGASAKARLADMSAAFQQTAATRQQAIADRQAEIASTAAAAQASRKAVADQAATVALTQRNLAETAATRATQANNVAQLQAVQQQLAADRALEAQRLQAQISDVGRQQSLNRIVEIRRTEAIVTAQQTAAQRALNQTAGQELIIQGQLAASQARLTTLREVDTAAVNAQNASQLRLNASQTIVARTAATGSAAMAALGGPVGLLTAAITVAAGAAIYFASGTDTATKALIDQNLTIDESIEKYRKLNDEQRQLNLSNWMVEQKKETDSAAKAIEAYRDKATQALVYTGQFTGATREEFNRLFSEVESGQRTLGSLTTWLSSSTGITEEYKRSLIILAESHSSGTERAKSYGEQISRAKEVTDSATSSSNDLAGAQSAAAAAVSGGSQAWDKYIAQLTQTRDLVGANAAQEAAYTATKAGFNKEQIEYARLLGEQTGLLKSYEQAIKDGEKAEQDRLKAQLMVSIKASEALRSQLEVHTKAMSGMAKATEASIRRQVAAYDKLAANSVWSSMNGGKAPLQFPFVGPQGQQEKSKTGAELLTFGQSQLSSSGETAEQIFDRLTAQASGNTETKTKKPAGEKGLKSKLGEAQTAFDALYKAAQPAKFALQEYVEKQGQLELLLSKGKITQQQYNEALAQSSINYAAAIKGAQGLTQAEQYRAQMERQLGTFRQGFANEADAVGMGQKQAQRAQDRIQIEQQSNDRILQLRTELANATTEKQRQDLQAQIDIEGEYLQKRIAAQRDGWRQIDEAQADWSNGARGAFQDYLNSAKDVAGQTRSLFSNAFSSMEDAIVQFAMTGKLSFADFAKSILADMARIAARQAASSALSSLFGMAASAAGSYFGGAASASAAAGATQSGYTGSGFSNWVAGQRASGGPVAPNSLYEVNERGPELYNQGGRSFLMTGANGGSVTPLTRESMQGVRPQSGGGSGGSSVNQVVIQQTISVQESGSGSTSTEADSQAVAQAYAKSARQGAQEQIAKDLRPGGQIYMAIRGRT